MPEYHQYAEYSIPVCTGKSARHLYNLPDDQIDRLRCGTEFTEDGSCMEPGGFRGTAFEDKFTYLSDQEVRELIEFHKANRSSILHLFQDNNVPVKDQNGHGYCVLADTLIRMADGTDRPIANLKLHDRVYTAEGNLSTVEQLHCRDYSGDLIQLRLWGHSHLRLTPNHSVLTKRGYVPARELTKNDWVRIPKAVGQPCKVLQTAQHAAPIKRYAGHGRADDTWNNHSIKELPDFIELTYEFGRLIGLYAAEGFCERGNSRTHRVNWAFNINERNTLAAEVVNHLEALFGETVQIRKNKANGCIVSVCGKQWASLFESLCGRLSHNKHLHADVMSGPKDFLRGVISGWMDGDGCDRKTFRIGATVSKRLATNLFSIANALGLRPSINLEKPQKNQYAKTRRPVWKLRIPHNTKNDYRATQDSQATWRRVRELDKKQYTGKVYNIGVAGDNSYIAEGLGVHNCWSYGAISAVEANRLVQGIPYLEFSPHSVAAGHMKGADRGGWASMALEWAQKYGIVPDSMWPKHSRNHRLWDQSNIAEEAAKYKPLEWVNIPEGDMQALRSLLAMNMACGMGLMWWGHLIMFGIIDWSDKYGWLYGQRNSHGPNFGASGWAFHTEASAKHGGGSTVLVA